MKSTPRLLAAFALLATVPGTMLAQRPSGASVRVSTDDWANEYVRLLRQRGLLAELNPLVQPYRAVDIARAVAPLDPDTLPRPVRDWVRILQSQFGWRSRRDSTTPVRWGITATGGVRASTSQRLDPLRPLGDAGAWPRGQGGAWLESGPIAVETRLLGDSYFSDDPDGISPGQRRGARSDFAYIAADFPVASIEVGRLARNWGPVDHPGAMISSVATPYPQLGLELRAWRFVLRSFTGELDTFQGQKRFIAAHRLDYETHNFVTSFGESNLYGPQSGGLSLRFFNPAEFLFFDQDNQPQDAIQNLMLDWQFWWRVRPLTLTGEFLLDDIDISPEGPSPEPMLYAFSFEAHWNGVKPWLDVGAQYEQVSAWAYRTPNIVDQYSYLGRGLGENFSDYDRLTVTADLYPPLAGLRLTPLVALQRQGEGNFRDSLPPYDQYLFSPTIFLGVKERTLRLGLRGRYQPTRFAWLAWDVGYNWIKNRNHVQDATDNLFSAAAELGVRIDLPLRRNR